MVADVPTPGPDAPEGALLVIPGDGREVFRLVRNDPPSSKDFQPRYGKGAAKAAGVSELLRQGLSHYLTIDDAQAVNTQNSMVAKLPLNEGLFNFARTGQLTGHLDVWGRTEDFVELAQLVE